MRGAGFATWLALGMAMGAAGLAGLALAVLAEGTGPAGPPRPMVAAHRGGALLWPENSLLAFRSAIPLGVEYLELDVHLSRDGEVVVIHDPTLDRTTTGGGPVRDRTLAELRALRLRDRDGAVTGESLPTLDEVAELAARTSRRLLVEIKVGPDRARYPGIEEQVLAVLDRRRMRGESVVMAFERETWRRLRALDPALRTGALYSPRMLQALDLTIADAMDEAIRAGVAFIGLHQALITPAAVAQARQAGILLGAWTVNEDHAIRRIADLGTGVIITDRPDLAVELTRP